MESVHFVVLNMDKNVDRLETLSQMFRKLDCKFTRIKAIDGFNMEHDINAKTILTPRRELFGRKFKNIDNGKIWIYNGTICTSFPNLSLKGHHGTKGLTLSNMKAFKFGLTKSCKFLCVLEDDSIIDNETYQKIISFANNKQHDNVDIVLLDDRHNGWGGAAGVLYNYKILQKLSEDLHPLSLFSITSQLYGDPRLGNLWDWKLWKYCNHVNNNFLTLPCVKSGCFASEINK